MSNQGFGASSRARFTANTPLRRSTDPIPRSAPGASQEGHPVDATAPARPAARPQADPGAAAEIRLEGVSKVYDDGTVGVAELDLTFAAGELTVLVGPSGGLGDAGQRGQHPPGEEPAARETEHQQERQRLRCPRTEGAQEIR